jgi:hypothetical protein
VRKRSLLLGLVLAWFLTWMGLAHSFDPLRRAEDEETAQLSWAIAAAYYPQGVEGAGLDEYGEYFTFVRFSGERRLSLSASWSFTRCHKLGMSLVERTTTLRERRWFATGEWEAISVVTGVAYSSYYEYRIAPDSVLDPRVRISCKFPEAFGLAASASCILDPVVLAGMLELVHKPDHPLNWLNLSLSAGLVANSRVTFATSAGLSVPVHDTGLPSASVALRTCYSIDPGEGLELSLQVSLLMQGQSSWMGVTLSIQGRGP